MATIFARLKRPLVENRRRSLQIEGLHKELTSRGETKHDASEARLPNTNLNRVWLLRSWLVDSYCFLRAQRSAESYPQ